MTAGWTKVFGIVVLLLFASTLLLGQAKPQQNSDESCRSFVQGFYDWYVPRSFTTHNMSSTDMALKYRPASFSSELRQALQEDSAAAAKNADEIVGLDFDPFLDTQDPYHKYVVKAVHREGDKCRADVFGVDKEKKDNKPDVVPEAAFTNGRWVFVNFHYGDDQSPDNENLLAVLKKLKEDREKPAP